MTRTGNNLSIEDVRCEENMDNVLPEYKNSYLVKGLGMQWQVCTIVCVLVAERHNRLVEFIGVLRHMQRYFSHICDSTEVQAD